MKPVGMLLQCFHRLSLSIGRGVGEVDYFRKFAN